MKFFRLFFYTIISLLLLNSCSDEPKTTVNYSDLRIDRMDLSGAVTIGLSNGSTNSRAIDGELASAGMYKIDANGNITAVGVYFTTDVEGNRLDHEESLRVAPKALFKLSDNFLLAIQCDYYDVEGDLVQDKFEVIDDDNIRLIKQEVPYKDLLVRISDGKIWCVDNVSEYLYSGYNNWKLIGSFSESKNGELYYCLDSSQLGNVYKFRLNNLEPSFEQIVKGINLNYNDFHVTENGVVWSASYNGDLHSCHATFAWENSGFQKFTPSISDIFEDNEKDLSHLTLSGYSTDKLILERECGRSFIISIDNNPYLLSDIIFDWYLLEEGDTTHRWYYRDGAKEVSDEIINNYLWSESAFLVPLVNFDSPGSVHADLEDVIFLSDSPKIEYMDDSSSECGYDIKSILICDNYILTSDDNYNSWLSIINLETKEWKWLKQLDYQLTFNETTTSKLIKSKVWSIDIKNLEAKWFDISSYENGNVNYNIEIPSFMNFTKINSNNQLVYGGYNPSTGNLETIYIEIETGAYNKEITETTLFFQSIIDLS